MPTQVVGNAEPTKATIPTSGGGSGHRVWQRLGSCGHCWQNVRMGSLELVSIHVFPRSDFDLYDIELSAFCTHNVQRNF